MSLPPVIWRDIGEEVRASERVIYEAYIRSLDRPSRTSPDRAVLRAAKLCGVSRVRVLEVVREVNAEALPIWAQDVLDTQA